MTLDHLLVEATDGVFRVTINRPEKRNALSRAVLDELTRVFTHHADDETLRLAILTGAGDRSFAAGGDLRDLATVRTPDAAETMSRDARAALRAVREFPVPVVAALNGDALGGGAELAVSCDFIASHAACRIGFIQGRLNISTAWGGGIRLLERVGPTMGLRLLTRAELLDAPSAADIGLIDVVSREDETLDDTLANFTAPMMKQVPQVMRAFKALRLAHSAGRDLQSLEALETRHLVETWVHDDHWAAADKVLTARKAT